MSDPKIITTLDVLSARGHVISRFLGEISNVPSGPAWKPRSSTREYIIGAHAGSPPGSDYRLWRFPTFVPGVHGMYFELWRMHSGDCAFLYRAYLSLYRLSRPGDTEEELL